jgi:hypothetical protein
VSTALAIVAAVLALIELVVSKGTSLLAWAVLALAAAILVRLL